MNITDIRIRKADTASKVVATASMTIDDCFVIHDIKLLQGTNNLFMAMPSKRVASGQFKDIAHPITSEARTAIQDALIEAYNSIKD